MPSCSIYSCKKRSQSSSLRKDNITFHLFPKHGMLRDVWIRACANHVSWTPKRTSTVCSEHFETCCFITQSNGKRRLQKCAMPTLNLPTSPIGPQVELREESKPGTDSPHMIKIKIEPMEDTLPPDPLKCQNEAQPFTSQPQTYYVTTTQTPPQTYLPDINNSPKVIKLRNVIQKKTAQIKRLHSQNRYLKKKLAELREILHDMPKDWLSKNAHFLVPEVIYDEEKLNSEENEEMSIEMENIP